MKVLRCAQCVKCVSESCNAEKSRQSVYLCTPPFRIVTLRFSIPRMLEKSLHHLTRFATGRPELVFFRLRSRRVAETSDVVGHGDCRHICDDENPTMKTLLKVTMSIETTMTTVQERGLRIVWSCFSMFHCTSWLYSGCSLVFVVSLPPPWLVVRPCIGPVVTPFLWSGCVILPFHSLFCQILQMSDCVYPCMRIRNCSCPRGSAPRSFCH